MAQTARRDDIVKVGQCYDVLNILKCYDILNILKSNMLKICIYRRGADGPPRRHRQGGLALNVFKSTKRFIILELIYCIVCMIILMSRKFIVVVLKSPRDE